MKITLSVLCLCLAGGLPWSLSGMEPTSPAQRERLVEIVRGLEKEAFTDAARSDRSWALTLIDRAPDIRVEINMGVIPELINAPIPNRPALYIQFLLGMASFVVEHPDRAADKAAVYEAAFSSCLKVYHQALALTPSNQIVLLDALAQKERDGTLHDYVVKLLASPDFNPKKMETPDADATKDAATPKPDEFKLSLPQTDEIKTP